MAKSADKPNQAADILRQYEEKVGWHILAVDNFCFCYDTRHFLPRIHNVTCFVQIKTADNANLADHFFPISILFCRVLFADTLQ